MPRTLKQRTSEIRNISKQSMECHQKSKEQAGKNKKKEGQKPKQCGVTEPNKKMITTKRNDKAEPTIYEKQ